LGSLQHEPEWSHLFFDQAKITVQSGGGGNGCVSFRREKFVRLGGPDGGNGGRGGSVYLRVNPQLNTLVAFNKRRHYEAEDGAHGQGQGLQGRMGADLYIDVPRGTVVRDHATNVTLGDLAGDGQVLLVARGGRGGRGNEVFKSSTRQTPGFAERGQPGEKHTLVLELKLIADVGLLGKPNAGKSTLLGRVSEAKPKVADYAFTTLSPSLGVVEIDDRTFVMADIPGLIEGAHEGAGLGLQFLRHVERTRLLLHLLDGSSPDPVADYRAINAELALYSEALAAKPQIVVVNKIDDPEARQKAEEVRQLLAGEVGQVYVISALTREGVPDLVHAIVDRLAKLPSEAPSAELHVFRPTRREGTAVTIVREGPGVFRLRGEEIERLAIMTDWSNYEAIERFERILRARDISPRLEEAGVKLGDTVIIGDVELEWR
jgi:GTP-binding protein